MLHEEGSHESPRPAFSLHLSDREGRVLKDDNRLGLAIGLLCRECKLGQYFFLAVADELLLDLVLVGVDADVGGVNDDLRDDVDVLLLDVEQLGVSDLLDVGSPREDDVLLAGDLIGEDAEVLDGLLDDAANGLGVVLEELVEDDVVLDDDL